MLLSQLPTTLVWHLVLTIRRLALLWIPDAWTRAIHLPGLPWLHWLTRHGRESLRARLRPKALLLEPACRLLAEGNGILRLTVVAKRHVLPKIKLWLLFKGRGHLKPIQVPG